MSRLHVFNRRFNSSVLKMLDIVVKYLIFSQNRKTTTTRLLLQCLQVYSHVSLKINVLVESPLKEFLKTNKRNRKCFVSYFEENFSLSFLVCHVNVIKLLLPVIISSQPALKLLNCCLLDKIFFANNMTSLTVNVVEGLEKLIIL